MRWDATASLDRLQVAQVCTRLADLALVTMAHGPGESTEGSDASGVGVTLHGVVRDFLRAELGTQRLAALHRVLLNAVAAGLPVASTLIDPGSHRQVVAWWEASAGGRYLRDHLIWHLRQAGRAADAEELACDLRWAGTRLVEAGPAAVVAGLSMAATPRAARLGVLVTQIEHLLAPCEPSSAIIDILHSRVAADPDWGPQVAALRDMCRRPRLVNRWPLPDLPDPALRVSLEGHQGSVLTLCPVRVDGQDLLASGGEDQTVRIWDPATGRQSSLLKGHQDRVLQACTVTVAGHDLLATASTDGTVRIWDPATGRPRHVLKGHRGRVGAVCPLRVAGQDLLASGGEDHTVRIWDPVSGRQRTVLKGHLYEVWSLCPVRVDGQDLLASGGDDGMVLLWDPVTRQRRNVLKGHWRHIRPLCPVRVDGQDLLAIADDDRMVGIWDPATGQQRAALEHAGMPVCPVRLVGRDLLAIADRDGTVRIWDPATGQQRIVLQDRRSEIFAACPVRVDGQDLFATAGEDGTVRIWDAAVGSLDPVFAHGISLREPAGSADVDVEEVE